MLVLYTLRAAYAQIADHIVPNFATMEGPPLPAAVLAAEASDYLLASRVLVDVGRAV